MSTTVPRVTIIDDDPGLLELTTEMLAESGCAATALVGCNDLAEIEATEPDVLILDMWLGMRSLPGAQIVAALREHPKMRNLPLIICSGGVTGVVDHEDALFAEPGIFALPKPFSIGDLNDVLMAALSSKEQTHPLAPALTDTLSVEARAAALSSL